MQTKRKVAVFLTALALGAVASSALAAWPEFLGGYNQETNETRRTGKGSR
ncbi:hypothetical protein HNR42_000136 [Deinobacterium chartae]|uniref:Uncharacterized protein n=1 Tax=Deinobacterium chartae TaxID=521158 RepID=A0A841HVN0_9DEIO|nr:hypothetical protein [Deinobacterium chartae]